METYLAFAKIVEYATEASVRDIRARPGLWHVKVDDDWSFAVNGHETAIKVAPGGEYMPVPVPPYTAVIWWKTLWVGTVGPRDGVMLELEDMNTELAFVAAMDRLISKTKSSQVINGRWA